jgi:hypothetical protein
MRPCPRCGKQIKDDVELCTYCLQTIPKAGEVVREDDSVAVAREAHAAGARILQIALPLSKTAAVNTVLSSPGTKTTTAEHGSILESIEREGWHLEHANYVFRVTGSVSRDKLFSSGQPRATPTIPNAIATRRMKASWGPPLAARTQ